MAFAWISAARSFFPPVVETEANQQPEEGLQADLDRGFLTHGLFRFSRHPNYFGELGVWWTIYILGSAVGGGSDRGPVVITCIAVLKVLRRLLKEYA